MINHRPNYALQSQWAPNIPILKRSDKEFWVMCTQSVVITN